MKNKPLISIIIPVFNMEQHLKECLDSITGQTYINLEIICVNDGSTDGSLDVINAYSQKDDRIKLIDQKNQGPLLARNTGLKAMNGEFFFFMDADDILHKEAINTLYSLMQKDGTQIALSNFRINGHINYRFKDTLVKVDDVLADVANCKARMFPCWGMLIGKCYVDNEFRGYRLCEDELYALDLFVDTDKVSYSPEELIIYRNKEREPFVPKDFAYYYQGYLAANDFYNMVCSERPNLQKFAKTRLLMHSFYCFLSGRLSEPDEGSNKEKLDRMKATIKTHRKDVIMNSHAEANIRVISLMSYLGFWLPIGLFKIYTKAKR